MAGGFFASFGAYGIYSGLHHVLTLGAVAVDFDSRIRGRGDALSVRVQFVPGRAAVLTKATVKLVGRERVTSGSEEDTETSTWVLHEETVWLGQGRQLQPGEPVELTCGLRIPPKAPYTFAARDNHVQWCVEISLAVAGWSEWKHEYPIAVVP